MSNPAKHLLAFAIALSVISLLYWGISELYELARATGHDDLMWKAATVSMLAGVAALLADCFMKRRSR